MNKRGRNKVEAEMKTVCRIGIGRINLLTAGGKAFNLHKLSKAGFNTATAFVLFNAEFKCYLDDMQIVSELPDGDSSGDAIQKYCKKIKKQIVSGNFPEHLDAVLRKIPDMDNEKVKWAVRSSSVQEDTAEASFAGLYDTFLNVRGVSDIEQAIQKCWASYYNERAVLYRLSKGLDPLRPHMAVILQHMVDVEWSGVLFTRSPSDPSGEYMVAEYCRELGEVLVSGLVTPSFCRIDRGNYTVTHHQTVADGMPDHLLEKLGELSSRIERLFQKPQDVEWVFDGDRFWILQSRPVIFVMDGNGVSSEDKIWTRANVGEVLPDVVTPYTWEIFKTTLLGMPLQKLGTVREGQLPVRLFNGRVYIELYSFLDNFCYLPFVSPAIMKTVLGLPLDDSHKRYVKPFNIKVILSWVLFFADVIGLIPRLKMLRERLPDIRKYEDKSINEIVSWCSSCFLLHRKCTVYAVAAFGLVAQVLSRWKPEDREGMLLRILTADLQMQSAHQGTSLMNIAAHVRKHKDLLTYISDESVNGIVYDDVMEFKGGREFIDMYKAFFRDNGDRAVGEFELSVPRWSEDHTFILSVLRSYLHSAASDRDAVAESLLKSNETVKLACNSLSVGLAFVFRFLLNAFKRYSAMRENVKYLLMTGLAFLRSAVLKQGALLVDGKILNDKNDVFYLKPEEIADLLSGEANVLPVNAMALVDQRRKRLEEFKDKPSVEIIGMTQLKCDSSEKNRLRGIACSPGVVTGRARVLQSIKQASELKEDEILVTHHTDPGWTPLFLTCKAVVTEIGGFLSHGATVAREYGIPAIAGVRNLTSIVHDGDVVCVNGHSGIVEIIKKKDRS